MAHLEIQINTRDFKPGDRHPHLISNQWETRYQAMATLLELLKGGNAPREGDCELRLPSGDAHILWRMKD